MPELPEVETIVNDLNKSLKNLVVIDFKVINEKTVRKRPFLNFPEKEFRKKIINKKITRVFRRAKHIVIGLEKSYLVVHLKMTGQLVFKKCDQDYCRVVVGGHPIVGAGEKLPNRFTRAFFVFNNNSSLYFNDVRRFGWIRLMDEREFNDFSLELGIEPLSKDFTLGSLKRIVLKKKNSTIKQAIMDQKYLVGVGNIYADEALYASGIKPARLSKSLSLYEITKLHQTIIKVLKLAIKHRGTSFNDYRDALGKKGNFLKYLKVYGRAGKECLRCGEIIKKSKIGGRGTHWCDSCQK